MKKSVFEKTLEAIGKNGKVTATIVVTMNTGTTSVIGTSAITHDEYRHTIPTHTVESSVNGSAWRKVVDLESEQLVLKETDRLTALTLEHINTLANQEPVKTFEQKLNDIFAKHGKLSE